MAVLDRQCVSTIQAEIPDSDTVFCRRKMNPDQVNPTLSQICCVSENQGNLRGKGFCPHIEMRATQEKADGPVILSPVI